MQVGNTKSLFDPASAVIILDWPICDPSEFEQGCSYWIAGFKNIHINILGFGY